MFASTGEAGVFLPHCFLDRSRHEDHCLRLPIPSGCLPAQWLERARLHHCLPGVRPQCGGWGGWRSEGISEITMPTTSSSLPEQDGTPALCQGQPLEGPAPARMQPVLGESETFPAHTPLPQRDTPRSFVLTSHAVGNDGHGFSGQQFLDVYKFLNLCHLLMSSMVLY